MKTKMRVLVTSILIALSPGAFADDPPSTTTGTDTSVHSSHPATKLAASFIRLAGSKENALALVNGLRNGTPISLTSPPATGTGTPISPTSPPATGTGTPISPATPPATGTGTNTSTSTTITPATGKMGWGNVKIALALAQHVLAANGITNPTPAQLNAALNGGDITVKSGTGATATTKTVTLNGILTERASGMGWGQIAKAEGTKVGTVLHEVKHAGAVEKHERAEVEHHHTAKKPGSTTETSVKAGTVKTKSVVTVDGVTTKTKSVVTADGVTTKSQSSTKGITTAASVSPSSARKGLVTAEGSASQAGKSSKGITTATGATSSGSASRGLVTADGATAGHAPKGNAYGRGIVSASGGSAGSVTAATGGKSPAGAGVVSGTGSNAASVTTAAGSAGGNGNGNGKGKGKS